MSFFAGVLLVGGTVGLLGAAWLMLSGRNFPGVLGRGFTNDDNVRLRRAPAIYFRAMGVTTATVSLLILDLGAFFQISALAPATDLTVLAILGGTAAGAFVASFVWLLVLTARHKLFRWSPP